MIHSSRMPRPATQLALHRPNLVGPVCPARFAAKGEFYLVDYDTARGLCKQCKLKFVPSGHIYSRGKLQAGSCPRG